MDLAFRSARLPVSLVLGSLFVSGVVALACGDGGDGSGNGSGDGDGGFIVLPDAAVGPSDARAPSTTMRLAHLAPELGPVDFCYRTARSTSFEGPVLSGGIGSTGRDASDDGSSSGEGGAESDAADDADDSGDGSVSDAGVASNVGYRSVSRYLNLTAAGPLTIALVAPGATSCATPVFTADVTLDPGKLSTVAIVGRVGSDGGADALALAAFIDDRATAPSKARVRIIHAALGVTATARTASGPLSARVTSSQTLSVAERIEPKKAGSPSAAIPIDSLGYATIAALPSPAQLAVGAAPGTATTPDAEVIDSWVSKATELDLRGGSLHTGFVLSGDDQQPFEVLWCIDTSTSGDRTTCKLVR